MIEIDGHSITYKDIISVAKNSEKITISTKAKQKVLNTRLALEKAIANKEVMYGITTGFGAFKNKVITQQDVQKLQENLIISHAVGAGEPFSEETVRAIMTIIINYLSKGYSGIRTIVIDTLIEMLNKGVHPVVPQKGSVGSSGDLAPSAHIILVLIGKGEAIYKGEKTSGAKALEKAKIKPISLEAKEGLALINNTATMTANATFAIHDAKKLLELADICGALSAEALKATRKAFDSKVHEVKPHKGQKIVAENLRKLLKKSTMCDDTRIQDQYSIRCIPQIHGAVRQAVEYVENTVNTELKSVTDNPLIFVNKDNTTEVISGGNFHGEAIAIAMDTLGVALCELANTSDRRVASLLDPATNFGLPAFLATHGGLNSGLMILQYTTASLVSENKILAHPASVDSIPTSANVEDLVSMGTIASRKAREIIENIYNVLTIESLVASQAIEFRQKEGLTLGEGTQKVFHAIRTIVPFFEKDSEYYPFIQKLLIYNKNNVPQI